jgi:hypothetical protein
LFLQLKPGFRVCSATLPQSIIKAENLFLDLLARFVKQDRSVNDKPGPSYAPNLFEQEPEAKAAHFKKKAFADAMSRLFADNRIHIQTYGRPSRQCRRLAPGPA